LPAYTALRNSLVAAGDKVNYAVEQEAFFRGSGFVLRENFSVRTKQEISVEDLAGRLLSMSNSSPAVLGPRAERIADEVREAVAGFVQPDGTLAEVVEAVATVLVRE
jgi:hypothetical protein